MRLDKYIPDGSRWHEITDIQQGNVARILLNATEAKRDEIREQNETRPMVCDEDITKDFRFKAGMVRALNWVLSLPEEARRYVDQLPET